MGSGDIRSLSDVIWFSALLVVIGALGTIVIYRLFEQCTMTKEDIKTRLVSILIDIHSPIIQFSKYSQTYFRLEQQDMVEMQDLMNERQYNGDIVLPGGC